MNIKILATCRNEELLPATTLVFNSIRLGFPTFPIEVYLNRLDGEPLKAVLQKCEQVGASSVHTDTIHHEWIQMLVETETEPFILLDTDIVFWKSCEDWNFETNEGLGTPAFLMGRYVPQFWDDFSNCITRSRLHGSHLWVNPMRVRENIEHWKKMTPKTPFTPTVNLFNPLVIPPTKISDDNIFFDTCSLLYHAISGERFTDEQNDCYDHLHCGTISDLTSPRMPQIRQREAHFAIFENPNLLRGAWREQQKFYERNEA